VSDPVSWVKFTQENIARSRGEREVSEKLRADIEICLRQCANDMVSQFEFINNALKARISENTDVKHSLEMHLQKVSQSTCADRLLALRLLTAGREGGREGGFNSGACVTGS